MSFVTNAVHALDEAFRSDIPKCVCDPLESHGHRFSSFIGENFKICAYTTPDIIGFACGLINILIWLFAQAPQLVVTYRNKTGGSISWTFLIIWLIGDVCNFFGSLWTSQVLLLYTAVYFMIMDGLVLGQIVYYAQCYKAKKPEDEEKEKENENDLFGEGNLKKETDRTNERTPFSPGTPQYYGTSEDERVGGKGPIVHKSRNSRQSGRLTTPTNVVLISVMILALSSIDLASATRSVLDSLKSINIDKVIDTVLIILQDDDTPPICDAPTTNSKIVKAIGTTCAWICGILYLTARIPQVLKIHKEKNVYGVSFLLFAMSFAANLFYAISILLPTTTNFKSIGFWKDTFPYLIGSLGANVFSAIVMVQFFLYPAIPPPEEEEEGKTEGGKENNNKKNKSNNENNILSDNDNNIHETGDVDTYYNDNHQHPIVPSHDYKHCPPHHHHDDGTGQVGELVLEISTAVANPELIAHHKTPGSSIQYE
jgi:uncharacterized protein with PQ loop repeat